jgi:hypothetical protein
VPGWRRQADLFDTRDTEHRRRLMTALDAINRQSAMSLLMVVTPPIITSIFIACGDEDAGAMEVLEYIVIARGGGIFH